MTRRASPAVGAMGEAGLPLSCHAATSFSPLECTSVDMRSTATRPPAVPTASSSWPWASKSARCMAPARMGALRWTGRGRGEEGSQGLQTEGGGGCN